MKFFLNHYGLKIVHMAFICIRYTYIVLQSIIGIRYTILKLVYNEKRTINRYKEIFFLPVTESM